MRRRWAVVVQAVGLVGLAVAAGMVTVWLGLAVGSAGLLVGGTIAELNSREGQVY